MVFAIEIICNFECEECKAWFSKASPTWDDYRRNSWYCASCGHKHSLDDEQLKLLKEHLMANTGADVAPFPIIEAIEEVSYLNVKRIVDSFLIHHGYEGLFNQGLCGCRLGDTMECYEDESGCEPGYLWTGDDVPEEEREDWDYWIGPKKPKKGCQKK